MFALFRALMAGTDARAPRQDRSRQRAAIKFFDLRLWALDFRLPVMATMEDALAALRQHFGFEDFREGQREVISAILEGRDTVVVMPTGGGKTLFFPMAA